MNRKRKQSQRGWLVCAVVGLLVIFGAMSNACQGGNSGAPGGAAPLSRATSAGPVPSQPSASPSHVRHRSRLAFGLLEVHDPGRVTGNLTGPCHAGAGGLLPDRRCTPGAVDPAVTQANIQSTICRAGYTETVRPPESQTEAFKFGEAYPAYGIPAGTVSELDHLVPLELGGANDAANLWPEAGPVPNPKDSVEAALNTAVCDGQVSLARAQRAIARNWRTAASRLGISAPAPAPASPPSAAGPSCSASVSTSSPADYTTVDVYVHTAAGASVTTVAHYKTTDHPQTAVADGAGQATIAYDISGATPGYQVAVDVSVSSGSRTAQCSTSFTPQS